MTTEKEKREAKAAIIKCASKIVWKKNEEGADEQKTEVVKVQVSNIKHLDKKLIHHGPKKLPDGAVQYLTIDGQKLRFDESTGDLL